MERAGIKGKLDQFEQSWPSLRKHIEDQEDSITQLRQKNDEYAARNHELEDQCTNVDQERQHIKNDYEGCLTENKYLREESERLLNKCNGLLVECNDLRDKNDNLIYHATQMTEGEVPAGGAHKRKHNELEQPQETEQHDSQEDLDLKQTVDGPGGWKACPSARRQCGSDLAETSTQVTLGFGSVNFPNPQDSTHVQTRGQAARKANAKGKGPESAGLGAFTAPEAVMVPNKRWTRR